MAPRGAMISYVRRTKKRSSSCHSVTELPQGRVDSASSTDRLRSTGLAGAGNPQRVGGIIAGEKLRAVRHPAVEQAALLQEVDEKWQLAEWRDRGGRIPFNVDPAGWIRPAKVSAIAERASTVGCSP